MSGELQSGRHIWLYAKRWYQCDNVLEDMRVLVADYVGSVPKYISDTDILTVVCDLALPYLVRGTNPERQLQRIFRDLIAGSQCEDRPLDIEDVVSELLSILRLTSTRDGKGNVIVNLGEPDYNLLARPPE